MALRGAEDQAEEMSRKKIKGMENNFWTHHLVHTSPNFTYNTNTIALTWYCAQRIDWGERIYRFHLVHLSSNSAYKASSPASTGCCSKQIGVEWKRAYCSHTVCCFSLNQ